MIHWYKLEFTTPVHVGERSGGAASLSHCVHSTTIHSAIVNALILLSSGDKDMDKDAILRIACSFRTTSLSPIIAGNTPLLWMRGLNVLLGNIDPDLYGSPSNYDEVLSKIKKVCLVQDEFLREDLGKCMVSISRDRGKDSNVTIVCGDKEYTVVNIYGGDDVACAVVSKDLGLSDNIIVATREVRGKNIIDRITQAARPYYLATLRYHKPLLLGIETIGEDISINDIEAALKLLGETGIGGKRSYGLGRFTFERISISIPDNLSSTYYVVEGLYSPSREYREIVFKRSIYTVKIHGSISGYTGITRKPIMAFEEGSIVYCKDGCNGLVVVDDEKISMIIRSFDPVRIPLNTSFPGVPAS